MPSKNELNETSMRAATGRGRQEWHALLDEFDCRGKGHKETARWLQEQLGVSAWWSQTITIDYERARGIRAVGQRSDGKFAVNVTRTIECSQEEAWRAFADADQMSRWFSENTKQEFAVGGTYENGDGDRGTFKKIVPEERIHFTWDNPNHCPGSLVIVEFVPKNGGRTAVAITHEKLPSKEGADQMREAWSWTLDCLKRYLETGERIGFDEWKASRSGA